MSLKLEFGFNVPRAVIYEALTHPMRIMQYTRARAQAQVQEGGVLSMLDGKIIAKFLTLRPSEYIKMEWRFDQWDSSSIVEMFLQDPEEDECDLLISQTKIPASASRQKLEIGWKHHIIEPMSQILGYPLKN